ncbi:MAG: DJ-1/PfpI family protein, partial [Bermanella sp.]
MLKVAILVTDRCQASSIHTLLDVFIAANYVAKTFMGLQKSPFNLQLVGLKKKATAYNQSAIDNVQSIQQAAQPDVLIIPGAFEATIDKESAQKFLEQYVNINLSLNAWHQKGVLLASACTGNFLLANSGLVKGRALTCHWASSLLAHTLFPHEAFQSHQLIIDHGDIISVGGASAIAQLALYLIAREHSRELALMTAKMMLIELNFEEQSRFAIFKPNLSHSDNVVLTLQEKLEQEFACPLDLKQFSSEQALSEKQIVRRFKKETNETPLSYLQKIRVEKAKLSLEAGTQ